MSAVMDTFMNELLTSIYPSKGSHSDNVLKAKVVIIDDNAKPTPRSPQPHRYPLLSPPRRLSSKRNLNVASIEGTTANDSLKDRKEDKRWQLLSRSCSDSSLVVPKRKRFFRYGSGDDMDDDEDSDHLHNYNIDDANTPLIQQQQSQDDIQILGKNSSTTPSGNMIMKNHLQRSKLMTLVPFYHGRYNKLHHSTGDDELRRLASSSNTDQKKINQHHQQSSNLLQQPKKSLLLVDFKKQWSSLRDLKRSNKRNASP